MLSGVPVAALVVGGSVLAGDGVIVVSQAHALAGGVTPGDSPGFPVDLNLPGSYALGSDLDVRGVADPQHASAIRVTADDVTIDLAGHVIRGPTVCGGTPVTLCAPTGNGIGVLAALPVTATRVRNGSIVGMGQAGLALAIDGEAESLTVTSCGGAGISLGPAASVTRSSVERNGGNGIFAFAGTVVDSVVRGNGGVGIEFAAQGLLLGTTVTGNGDVAVDASLSAGYGRGVFTANGTGGANGAQSVGGIHKIAGNVCGTDTECP
jgi:hypothetical protein